MKHEGCVLWLFLGTVLIDVGSSHAQGLVDSHKNKLEYIFLCNKFIIKIQFIISKNFYIYLFVYSFLSL